MNMDYVAVIRDFKNGTLDRDTVSLCIDNDGGYWNVEDDESGDACDELEEKYGSPGGYQDVVAVLNAAGVPADWV